MKRILDITVDLKVQEYTPIKLKQIDTTQLNMTILDNTVEVDLTGMSANLIVGRENKTTVIQSSGISIENNKVQIILIDDCLRVKGKTTLEIELKKNDETVSTFCIPAIIEGTAKGNMQSTNTPNYWETLDKAAEEETKRVQAEASRVEAETARAEAESKRAENFEQIKNNAFVINIQDIANLKAETNELQKKNKLFNISITNLGNLFDCNFYKDNTQTNATYPNGSNVNGWISSDFIEIKENKDYRTSGALMYMNFYDADKQYISTLANGTTTIKGINSPANARYCIFSCQKVDINNLVVADIENYIGTIENAQLNFKMPLYKFNNYIISDENIIDNTIPLSKLDIEIQNKFKSLNFNKTDLGNLFDCNFYKDNTQTNATYPNGSNVNGWISSDFIEIKENKDYRTSGALMYMNFYDANKQYISTSANSTNYIKAINSPALAKYCILSCQKADINNLVVVDIENYIGTIENAQLNFKEPLYELKNIIFDGKNIIDNSIPLSKLDIEIQNRINNSIVNYFKDKTINFLGDSITFGYNGNYPNDNIASVDKPYPAIVKELLNCQLVNNYGSNGSTISGDGINSGTNPMNIRFNNMDETADYVVVFGGTNDHGQNITLGKIEDITNITFYGSLDILIKGLIEKYPTKRIAFITPLRKINIGANENGNTLEDFVNAIKEKCKQYAIPVLDFYNESGCIPQIESFKINNLPDGLHPNQAYYYTLAKKIANFIETL